MQDKVRSCYSWAARSVGLLLLSLLLPACGSKSQLPTAPRTTYEDKPGLLVDHLIEGMHSDDPKNRKDALLKLDELSAHVRHSIAPVVGLLNDPDGEVRTAAAMRLGDYGIYFYSSKKTDAVAALRKCLDDDQPRVRVYASDAIYRLTGDSQTTVPVLSQALTLCRTEVAVVPSSDPQEFIRQSQTKLAWMDANSILGGMGPDAKEALDVLIELWREHSGRTTADIFARTIGKIDPERAKELGINIEELADGPGAVGPARQGGMR